MSIYAPVDGTTERLLALADAIEQHPEYHDQETWIDVLGPHVTPREMQGKGMSCGTACCIAGGLESDLATAIFAGRYNPDDMPGVLRIIASVPEGERTVRAAIEAGLKELQGANLYGVNLSGLDTTGVNFDRATRYLHDGDIPGWFLDRDAYPPRLMREDKAKELGLVTP